MASPFEVDEAPTAQNATNVSGVHEAQTEPAPHVEDPRSSQRLVGSVPIDALGAFYSPVVDLNTGRTPAFEAVVCCDAPGLATFEELYARATFEKRTGELGREFRQVALSECAGTPVFVGIHPDELKDGWLIRPDDPLGAHDAEVYLQVAQSYLPEVCRHVLREVGARGGISLVVDDLGAGASSLQQVAELSPAFVKIDPRLIDGLHTDPRRQAIVRGIERICTEVGARVIAKGIDDHASLKAVRECGIGLGQGLLFGEPSRVPCISVLRLGT